MSILSDGTFLILSIEIQFGYIDNYSSFRLSKYGQSQMKHVVRAKLASSYCQNLPNRVFETLQTRKHLR